MTKKELENWRWSQSEASQIFNVNRSTLRTWQLQGCPHERRGQRVYFRPNLLFLWRAGWLMAERYGLEFPDPLYYILLAANTPPTEESRSQTLKRAGELATALDRPPEDGILVLGELIGKGWVAKR